MTTAVVVWVLWCKCHWEH